jgi:hypothetical protein
MAYRTSAVLADSAAETRITGESAHLGRDEWSVVELARRDSIWSLNPDGLIQRLVRIAFGLTFGQPLANERLEALRRFAVVAWNRTQVGADWVCQLMAAGFTLADARMVLDYVSRRRQLQSWPRGLA